MSKVVGFYSKGRGKKRKVHPIIESGGTRHPRQISTGQKYRQAIKTETRHGWTVNVPEGFRYKTSYPVGHDGLQKSKDYYEKKGLKTLVTREGKRDLLFVEDTRKVKPKPMEKPKLPKKEVVVPKIEEPKPKPKRIKKPKKVVKPREEVETIEWEKKLLHNAELDAQDFGKAHVVKKLDRLWEKYNFQYSKYNDRKALKKMQAIDRVKKELKKPKKVPCPYCGDIVTLDKRGLISTTHLMQHKRVKGKIISTRAKPKAQKPSDADVYDAVGTLYRHREDVEDLLAKKGYTSKDIDKKINKMIDERKLDYKHPVLMKTKPKKPKRIRKPKKHKIKPPKPRAKMTHIEKMHLLASAKQFNIDPQEIDNTLTYYENKKHIHEMARSKGVSEMEISSSEKEAKQWTSQYEEYLGNLKGELEGAGYTVTSP